MDEGGPRGGWVLSVIYHSPYPLFVMGKGPYQNSKKMGDEENAHRKVISRVFLMNKKNISH